MLANSRLWWALLLMTPLTASMACAAPAGLLCQVKGRVTIYNPATAKWSRASLMQVLSTGGKVRVDEGAEATVVLFEKGLRFQLAAACIVQVGTQSCTRDSGPEPKLLPPLNLRQSQILQTSSVAAGRPASAVARPMTVRLETRALADTGIMTPQPEFKWLAIAGATHYTIQLRNGEGDEVWNGETTQTSLAYPATAPHLAADVPYTWSVATSVEDKTYRGSGAFHLLTAELQAKVQQDLEALAGMPDESLGEVLKGDVYARNDLKDDAIATYLKFVTASPEAVAVNACLAELLASQGRAPESEYYRKRAEDYTKRQWRTRS